MSDRMHHMIDAVLDHEPRPLNTRPTNYQLLAVYTACVGAITFAAFSLLWAFG